MICNVFLQKILILNKSRRLNNQSRLSSLQVLLLKLGLTTFCITLLMLPSLATASWRGGLGLGFGGSGIKKEVESATLGKTIAEKSEGFGMMHFFIETLWTDTRVIGLEHSRGFRLGPFSSGVGSTTFNLKWHYLGPAPDVYKKTDNTTLFIKRWSPYVGPIVGVASGSIKREGDDVPYVSSSGVVFGIKNGIDYLLSPSLGMRVEISAHQTIFQAATRPANMTEFSLWYGIFVPLF